MSRSSNHIINPLKPNHWKDMQLPGSYVANLYNQFAVKLGTGRHVYIRVDPLGHSQTVIGYIELDSPPEKGKTYTVEVKLDGGNIYLECTAEGHKARGKGFAILLNSKQPPKTWLSKST